MSESDPAVGSTPGPGSADAVPPAPPAPPPPRKWSRGRKILVAVVALLFVSLGAAAALLPMVLSSEAFRNALQARASSATGRKVVLGGFAMNYSRTEVRGLEVRAGPADSDPVLLKAAEVRVPAGLLLAFRGRYDVGTIEVKGLDLRVDLREAAKEKKEKEDAAARPAGAKAGGKDGAAAAPVPPFSAKVSVTDGTLTVVDLEGKERRVGTFTADLSAASDAPAKARLLLDLGVSGKTQVDVEAKAFVGGRPAPADSMEVAVKATAEALDLGALRELIVGATGLGIDELSGVVSAKADVLTLGSPGTAMGTVVFQGKGLVAAGPALGAGVRFEEPVIKFAAGFLRGSDGTSEVKDVALEMEGLNAKGNLSVTTAGVVNGLLQAKVSLQEMRKRAQRLGRSPPRVLQGELDVNVRAMGDPKTQRVTGNLQVLDMHVGPAAGKLPLEEEEVVCDFDAVRIGKGFRIDSCSVRSGSLLVNATGSGGEDGSVDVKATVKMQIARIQEILAAFGLPAPGQLAGVAELEIRALRSPTNGTSTSPAESTATLTIRDLVVLPPGAEGTPIREPLLEARLAAVPGKDSIEIRSLEWKGAGADLRAAGTVAADGKSGRLSTVDASLDLAKVASLAGSLGTPLPARLSGTATWKGPVSWKDTFDSVTIEGGAAELRGLEALFPAKDGAPERLFREDSVRLSLDATVGKAATGRDVTIGKAVLAAAGLDATASGTLAADGTMALKAAGTLGIGDALRRAAAASFLDKDPGTRGALDFDLSIRGKPDAAEVVLDRFETRDAEFLLRGKGKFAVAGAADLDLEAEGDLGVLAGLAARAGFKTPEKGAAGKATARIAAKAAGPDAPLAVTFDAGVEGLRWPDSEGGLPWTLRSLAASVKTTVDRKAESAAGEATVKTDDGVATARGTFAYGSGKRAFDMKADLDMDLVGLCRSRPDLLPLEEFDLGRVKGNLAAGGPVAEPFDLAKIAATARLDLESVKTQPIELRNASGDFFLQNGTFASRNLAAKVNDGTVKALFALGLSGREPKHLVEVHAEGVRIDPAMAFVLRQVVPLFAIGESGGVSGALKIDLRLDGQGASWTEVKPNLHGKGTLAVADGTVTGNGIVGEVLELLGGGKGLGFNVLSTEFDVRDQRVWNERLTVDGKDHAMVIKGSTTFDGKLDYRVGAKALKVSKKNREKLKAVTDEDGNLPFQIAGTLAKPKVKAPDLKKALGAAADELLDRLKEKHGDDDDDKKEKEKKGKKKQ